MTLALRDIDRPRQSRTNRTKFTYDPRNRLASWKKGDGPQVHFSYDALGNLTGHEVATAGATNQTFGDSNHPHRITAASHSGGLGFSYDADGNLATQTGAIPRQFTFDSQNRLTCVGTTSACTLLQVAYDAEGRRIRDYSVPSVSRERFYLGDLFTLERPSGADPQAYVHVFAFGREIVRKTIIPGTLRTAEPTGLPALLPDLRAPAVGLVLVGSLAAGLWIGLVLLPGLAGRPGPQPAPAPAGAALVLAVLLVVPPVPAARAGGGGTAVVRNWLVSDHLGSAQATVASDGYVVRETTFKPFGKVDDDVYNGGQPKRAIFAGHRLEGTTDLYYMQARWMNPATGTFLSIDPLVADAFDSQSVNAYSYARNNPVSLTDPTGREFVAIWGWMGDTEYTTSSSSYSIVFNTNVGGSDYSTTTTLHGDGSISYSIDMPGWHMGTGAGGSYTTFTMLASELSTDEGHFSVTLHGAESQGQPGTLPTPAEPTQSGSTDVPRWPDFFSINVNVAIPNPLTGTLVGGTGAVTIDENGDVYVGLGPSVGKTLTVVSGSAAFGWLNQKTSPTEGQLRNFLTGHAFNAGAGFWGGGAISNSPGTGTSATSLGFFSPQAGGGYTYSWHVGDLWR